MANLQEQKEKVSKKLENIDNVIMVMSGKGGVGKTTVAVNLAVALALEGRKVGLLDVDLHGPDVVRMLGGREAKVSALGEEILPPEVHGIKVISISQFLDKDNDAVIWRGPLKTSAIMQFIGDVAWGELDYLIIDAPPGTGDEPLTVFQNVEKIKGALIVTSPSVVSQDDVERAINFVEKMNKQIIGIVENMSYFICPNCKTKHFIFGEDGGRVLAEKYNLELLAQIPLDSTVRENMDAGKPVAYFGNPELTNVYVKLGKKVIEKVETVRE
ncbi:MAG TPA: ATP-binding protein [Petrotoga sp.]|nr:MAG: Cobyrinic acid a,c-diamide synthase [Petrotoga mobilis]HBT51462.1 ATP-binding protein [Petrotoga sp.]